MPSCEPIQRLPHHFGFMPYMDASIHQLWVWIRAAVYEDLKYVPY
jgi:hypothetical protein